MRTASIIRAMKMNDAVRTFEKSVYFNETVRRHIPDMCNLPVSSLCMEQL
jgi:hypothetical protein